MTTILNLPSELIADIVSYLDTDDVFSTRRSNRGLERASFAHFGKRFFRKKGYMITKESIEVLKAIAAHTELRKYVQHIWLNPDLFLFATPSYVRDRLPYDDDESPCFQDHETVEELTDEDRLHYAAWASCMASHKELLHTGKLAMELSTAFSTLPNLKALGMRRSEDHSPWGWQRLQEATGYDPRVLGDIPSGAASDFAGPTYLYIALVKALAASGAQIQRFYTDAVEIDSIPADTLPTEILSEACKSVLYIELNATRAWINKDTYRILDHEGQPERIPLDVKISPDRYGTGLSRLMSAMPHLREIGLMIFPDRKQFHLVPPKPGVPGSWSSSYPYITLERLSSSVNFRHLRRVKLEKFTASASILLSVLKRSAASLTSLKIRDVRLITANDELFAEPQNSRDPVDNKPWQHVFAFLATSCPSLNYLLLNHLSHDTGGIRFVADLPPQPPRDPNVPVLSTIINAGDFVDYENMSVDVRGLDLVQARVKQLVEGHWHNRNIFSYAMDETIWHTDTSDEEW